MRRLSLLIIVGLLTACADPDEDIAVIPSASTGAHTTSSESVTGALVPMRPVDRFEEDWRSPVDRAFDRVYRKPFGLLVSPENSPVSPERFTGYHTGVDFELFEGESASGTVIRAACDGDVTYVDWVSGYGGILVQRCVLAKKPVTVVYGHLRRDSIDAATGTPLAAGDAIGVLGVGMTEETDGERAHLHFAVHRGTSLNVRGYVASDISLREWINPLDMFPR